MSVTYNAGVCCCEIVLDCPPCLQNLPTTLIATIDIGTDPGTGSLDPFSCECMDGFPLEINYGTHTRGFPGFSYGVNFDRTDLPYWYGRGRLGQCSYTVAGNTYDVYWEVLMLCNELKWSAWYYNSASGEYKVVAGTLSSTGTGSGTEIGQGSQQGAIDPGQICKCDPFHYWIDGAISPSEGFVTAGCGVIGPFNYELVPIRIHITDGLLVDPGLDDCDPCFPGYEYLLPITVRITNVSRCPCLDGVEVILPNISSIGRPEWSVTGASVPSCTSNIDIAISCAVSGGIEVWRIIISCPSGSGSPASSEVTATDHLIYGVTWSVSMPNSLPLTCCDGTVILGEILVEVLNV